MSYILALDEGTTSCRAIVFDDQGDVRAVAQRPLQQYFPQPGWVEHDPLEIWTSQAEVAVQALAQAGASRNELAAIGITNQRETTILWDRDTGEPLGRAIVWQDRRTAPLCQRLQADGYESLIQKRTGLLIDAYFSATKIAWMLDNIPGARAKAEAGRLAVGTVDSWLVWKLTAGALHITDATNASRTMLYNIHTHEWDAELLKLFRIPRMLLPKVHGSREVYAQVAAGLPGWEGVPIAGLAGDQQAALFGQLCLTPGATKVTYGTGCFMLQHLGDHPTASRNRLLTTAACGKNSEPAYALEGSVFIGGAVVQWLRDGLGLIEKSEDVVSLAASVPDSGGVSFVPAFAGLGAPHWDSDARGLMIGLTRGTTAGHIARAAVESIAYQVADLIAAMQADAGLPLKELRVDGGATRDELLMQFQADLLGVPLIRPANTETTALGAAFLAGLSVGVWKDTAQLQQLPRSEHRFEPQASPSSMSRGWERWRRAVERAKGWDKNDE